MRHMVCSIDTSTVLALDFHLSVAIPTLVFQSVATRTTQASRDQVQTVGGLDPASQLLAPAAYRFQRVIFNCTKILYHNNAPLFLSQAAASWVAAARWDKLFTC
jgi:hypothetical protein